MVMFRTTTGEIELSGVRLKADTKVGYYAGAANRDPRKWDVPDRYDLTRDVAGIHRAEPRYRLVNTLRTLDTLPLRVTPT